MYLRSTSLKAKNVIYYKISSRDSTRLEMRTKELFCIQQRIRHIIQASPRPPCFPPARRILELSIVCCVAGSPKRHAVPLTLGILLDIVSSRSACDSLSYYTPNPWKALLPYGALLAHGYTS